MIHMINYNNEMEKEIINQVLLFKFYIYFSTYFECPNKEKKPK